MIALVQTVALVAAGVGLYSCLRRFDILEQRLDLMERRERLNR